MKFCPARSEISPCALGSCDIHGTKAIIMETRTLRPAHHRDAGPRVLSHLGAAGALEVLRITKAVRKQGEELLFTGVPGRHGSKARQVRVRFNDERVAPRFDTATGTIELWYTHRDHPEVQALLNSKRNRFCYFWQTQESGHTHAWLLSSP